MKEFFISNIELLPTMLRLSFLAFAFIYFWWATAKYHEGKDEIFLSDDNSILKLTDSKKNSTIHLHVNQISSIEYFEKKGDNPLSKLGYVVGAYIINVFMDSLPWFPLLSAFLSIIVISFLIDLSFNFQYLDYTIVCKNNKSYRFLKRIKNRKEDLWPTIEILESIVNSLR
jgi:hypothetical protein